MSTSLRVHSFDSSGQAVATSVVNEDDGSVSRIVQHSPVVYSALVAEPTGRASSANNRVEGLNRSRRASTLTVLENTPGMVDDTPPVRNELNTRRPDGPPPPQHLATPQIYTNEDRRLQRRHTFSSPGSDSPAGMSDSRRVSSGPDEESDDDDKNLRQVPTTQHDPIPAMSEHLIQVFEGAMREAESRDNAAASASGARNSPQRPSLRQMLMILEQETLFDRLGQQKKYKQSLQSLEDRYGVEIATLRSEMERSKKIHKLVRHMLRAHVKCCSL